MMWCARMEINVHPSHHTAPHVKWQCSSLKAIERGTGSGGTGASVKVEHLALFFKLVRLISFTAREDPPTGRGRALLRDALVKGEA